MKANKKAEAANTGVAAISRVIKVIWKIITFFIYLLSTKKTAMRAVSKTRSTNAQVLAIVRGNVNSRVSLTSISIIGFKVKTI